MANRRGRRWAAAFVVAALGSGGVACGSGGEAHDPPPAPAPRQPVAQFVGTSPDGVGVNVDFLAIDALTGPVRRAVGGTGDGRPRVAVVAVVNDSDRAVPAPSLIAVLPNGGAVPMVAAQRVVAGMTGPQAHRARDLLPPPLTRVPRRRAATMYMVLRGADPGALSHINAVFLPGEPHRLEPRRR